MRIFIIHNFYQHAGGEDFVFRKEVAELSKIHDVKTYSAQNKKELPACCNIFHTRLIYQKVETSCGR